MVRERRVSSDGLKLFNMAMMHPPRKSLIKKILFCLFHTEYDDRLEEMVSQCRVAAQQLLSYTHYKDIDIGALINNSIFNLVHSTLMEDGTLLKQKQILRNYRYFFDVMDECSKANDHHSSIVILSAMMHHALGQFRFKKRKKDVNMLKEFEHRYGTFKNCYKQHLKDAMTQNDYETYLPCLMVLRMHRDRHQAFSTLGRCKVRYEPGEIDAKVGMHAMHHYYPGEKMALFETPEITSNTDLILLAQGAKK